MGMSSSQARLLTLTGRMHDIEYKAARLEAQKLQMANESSRVYENYLNALEATKIQYKSMNNDGSVKYNDATYFDLLTGKSGTQFVLCSTTNGKALLPENIKAKYEAAGSAADFATSMTGYTPPVVPVSPDPVVPTPTPTEPENPGTVTPYEPGDPVTPSDDPDIPTDNPVATDITLSRGQSRNSVSIDATGVTLCLTNPFSETSGQQYYYTIKSTAGSTASFQFLNNGRLVIRGNNLQIEAGNNQADDIILYGNGNTLDTGNKNDIVRVGYVVDDPSRSESYSGDWFQSSNNNTVNTGSGNDHIISYGTGNRYNGGADTDTSIIYGSSATVSGIEQNIGDLSNSTSYNYYVDASMQGTLGDCRYLALLNSMKCGTKGTSSNFLNEFVEITKSGTNYTVNFKQASLANKSVSFSQSDMNSVSWSKGDPDMRIIEYALNKLIVTNTGNAHNLETDSYQDYSRYMFGTSNTSMYLNESFYGDWINPDNNVYLGESEVNCTSVNASSNKLLTKSLMQHLWQKVQDGTISNIIVGAQVENTNLHIVSGHAYGVSNVQNDYIELINPWDNQDRLRLSWSDFLAHYDRAYVFGDTSNDEYTNIMGGVDMYNGSATGNISVDETVENEAITVTNLPGETGETDTKIVLSSLLSPETGDTKTGIVFGSLTEETGDIQVTEIPAETGDTAVTQLIANNAADAENYYYYYNLYNAIKGSGGCEVIEEALLTNKDYLVNVLNGGYAYLKECDQQGLWHETSVATNTSLQEINNEKELKKAEAKYEADMRRIDLKDRKYDTELAALDSERNAIKQEIDTLKTVAKDNVERTFKLFS